jgi:hypothetical protein
VMTLCHVGGETPNALFHEKPGIERSYSATVLDQKREICLDLRLIFNKSPNN